MEFPDLEKALGIDVNQLARQMREQTAQAEELRRQVAGLVGHAESDDGQVRLGVSSAGGLTELSIDPRAMRMGSDNLARMILDLFGRARADLDRQKQEAARETLGDDFDPAALTMDAKTMEGALKGMSETVESAGQNITALMEQLRRRLGT
ncbi:MAG TPA: YbaB/EbfC family nucleoid-associated protein [Streptosporangiaceae bacterium]|nr:YbaB/EbfC family nucleoid-associated protein [Streptosporangiaceae bacterium]